MKCLRSIVAGFAILTCLFMCTTVQSVTLKDRVKEISTSTGTGTITLGGTVSGFVGFSAVGDGNTTYYVISHRTANEWEIGVGTYTATGTTLSRDTVLASSNAGSLVNFGAGTKDVFVSIPASRFIYADESGNVGIGIIASNAELQVNDSGAGASVFLKFSQDGTGSGATDGFNLGITSAEFARLWNYENTRMQFATNNIERMTISAAGFVGFGDTSPDSPLEILSTTDPQFRISHTDGVDDATFGVDSSGNLTITPSGGATDFVGQLGIGVAPGSASLNVSRTFSGSSQHGMDVRTTLNDSSHTSTSSLNFITTVSHLSGAASTVGLQGQVTSNASGTGTINTVTGIQGIIRHNSANTITTARAVHAATSLFNGTGTVSNLIGFNADLRVLTNATVTNVFGFRVDDVAHTGTVTNAYGYYIDPNYDSVGATNIWGVYVDSDVPSYFEGNVGIKDTSPDSPLEILSTTDPQFRISHTDGVDDATFGVNAAGNMTITASGGVVGIGTTPVVGTTLTLPLENDAATPTLAFGDGDTGFFEAADDKLAVTVLGNHRFNFVGNRFEGDISESSFLVEEGATAINPTFGPNRSALDTGMGGVVGTISLITGGVEAVNIDGNQSVSFKGRNQGNKGSDVASADEILLGTGNYFDVTGTTTIHHVTNTDWQAGAVVILQFDASVTVTHNSATPTGTEASLFLQGAVDFLATVDDTLTLVYDDVLFRETSRSVN